mgnify:CR=1 FL=1
MPKTNAERIADLEARMERFEAALAHISSLRLSDTNGPYSMALEAVAVASEAILSSGKKYDPKAHLLSLGVSDVVIADFIAMRKARRAPVTETVVKGIQREASKARIALSDALSMCCERGWQSFKAEWLERERMATHGPRISQRDMNQEAIARSLFGQLRGPEIVVDGDVLDV